MFENYCVSEEYTVKEVLDRFQHNNDRIAIVLNGTKKVIGVISQGDILRALASGRNLYVQVNQIISNSFLHLYSKDMEVAYRIFRKKKITLLPIVDENNILVDVITLDDIWEYLEKRNKVLE